MDEQQTRLAPKAKFLRSSRDSEHVHPPFYLNREGMTIWIQIEAEYSSEVIFMRGGSISFLGCQSTVHLIEWSQGTWCHKSWCGYQAMV
jgi:hypothetical protein